MSNVTKKKPEMTVEKLIKKHEYGFQHNNDGFLSDLRSVIRDNAEMIRDKMIEIFRIEAELKHCRKSYYDRVKWYFETYQDELFGIPKDEFLSNN